MQLKNDHLTLAERGTLISIIIYTVIASLKIILGTLFKSSALSADGWNNFTDVLSSVAVFFGIRLAKQPADEEHQYGHWKVEGISSLMSSFIMCFIGLQVLFSSFTSLVQQEEPNFDLSLAAIGIFASALMFATYFYNHRLANRIQSMGLKAVAQNNLADAFTSLSTAISIFFAVLFKWYWIDSIMAIFVSAFILNTAFSVFKESAFALSDGFDTEQLEPFRKLILSHPEIHDVRSIKARHYGANIYVDVTVLMNAHLTVKESHDVTETIEKELSEQFGVTFTDVHVEPYE
ncbi:cation diffusion facilitator family transporter [Granulicatella sp. zg-ZJ]|uniref:cation diffusion facilitator family transporter n=1 Tax=unclassified Granulicatella TaxID=2630493 RepID=UPI0013C151A4|nr:MULTISPECIES: cation diffusion facilitator family transporter [unclassified Granulicatella]MBS4750736.1 cation transporter [Carnobacteriaceae bacterium zg-ZUI78]NEW62612.1 cation diffusion facilitator family transporter [Granulicatella sp. zg-ZJ]NEW66470.1 cation diffusion facilitator family transporter [Granulicatella sp. zg-84]QMI86013.1 cation transporter [Carnobacteriaceae bacterium zg-84]